jgi:hypothetical protein
MRASSSKPQYHPPAMESTGVLFSIEPGIYLKGKFGVRSEIDVYVGDKDIEVTGQPIQTEIVPILKAN